GEAPGEAIRFYLLTAHYRQPLDWTREGLQGARQTMDRFYLALRRLAGVPASDAPPSNAFVAALEDDLNTPQAIAELHKGGELELAGGLGLLGFSNTQIRIEAKKEVDTVAIADAIAARNAARKARNFAESDRIRDELLAKGIVLKDGPSGTTWEVKR
ncbi:MAG TPA: DALR domain-containing protein, partial [Rhizomicrobium sp.]|nr:DALR domain-containing protein [Rhizomicrobium sp.]